MLQDESQQPILEMCNINWNDLSLMLCVFCMSMESQSVDTDQRQRVRVLTRFAKRKSGDEKHGKVYVRNRQTHLTKPVHGDKERVTENLSFFHWQTVQLLNDFIQARQLHRTTWNEIHINQFHRWLQKFWQMTVVRRIAENKHSVGCIVLRTSDLND